MAGELNNALEQNNRQLEMQRLSIALDKRFPTTNPAEKQSMIQSILRDPQLEETYMPGNKQQWDTQMAERPQGVSVYDFGESLIKADRQQLQDKGNLATSSALEENFQNLGDPLTQDAYTKQLGDQYFSDGGKQTFSEGYNEGVTISPEQRETIAKAQYDKLNADALDNNLIGSNPTATSTSDLGLGWQQGNEAIRAKLATLKSQASARFPSASDEQLTNIAAQSMSNPDTINNLAQVVSSGGTLDRALELNTSSGYQAPSVGQNVNAVGPNGPVQTYPGQFGDFPNAAGVGQDGPIQTGVFEPAVAPVARSTIPGVQAARAPFDPSSVNSEFSLPDITGESLAKQMYDQNTIVDQDNGRFTADGWQPDISRVQVPGTRTWDEMQTENIVGPLSGNLPQNQLNLDKYDPGNTMSPAAQYNFMTGEMEMPNSAQSLISEGDTTGYDLSNLDNILGGNSGADDGGWSWSGLGQILGVADGSGKGLKDGTETSFWGDTFRGADWDSVFKNTAQLGKVGLGYMQWQDQKDHNKLLEKQFSFNKEQQQRNMVQTATDYNRRYRDQEMQAYRNNPSIFGNPDAQGSDYNKYKADTSRIA